VGTQLAAEDEAVPAWEQDVEDDQIDAGVGQDLHHRVAIGGDRDVIAVLPEEFGEQSANLLVVIDDQEVSRVRSTHTSSIAVGSVSVKT
jgi:hypothetical protein